MYAKLREFSRTHRRSLVVLAASGLLSSATLMQLSDSSSGGSGSGVTLSGSFTVLSISGALLQVCVLLAVGLQPGVVYIVPGAMCLASMNSC